MLRLLVSLFLLSSIPSLASALEVYGFVPGFKTAQPITAAQMNSLKKPSHGGVATWYVIVSDLTTSNPKVHIVDTDYFEQVPSKYGTHEAYALQMGFAKSDTDYIARVKADGRPRYFMPFIMYILPNGKLILQNRRYVYKDNSKNFAASLIKCEQIFQQKLSDIVNGQASFVTYHAEGNHHRPNTLTAQGQGDIEALNKRGYEVLTEEEIAP